MEIGEPPVEPVTPEPTPVQPPAPGKSLLSSIRVIGHGGSPLRPSQSTEDPPAEPPEEDPKPSPEPTPEPEPKATAATPEPKPEPKPDPTAGLSPKAAERFNNLEKHKKQAEEERDTARRELESTKAEYESLKKQAAELENLRRDANKAIEEAKTYREQLRAVAIERDPEFQQQFNGEIHSRQQQMLDMAVAAGVDQAEFVQALNSGNEEALESFRDSLPASRQRVWDAKRIEIEDLAAKRKQAIGNPEATWAKIEEARKQRAEQENERARIQNVEASKAAVDAIRSKLPNLDQAASDQLDEIQEWLTNAVTNGQREQLIQDLAAGAVSHRIVEAQGTEIERLNTTITEKDAKIAELEEKLGEQETFIKDMSSRVPRNGIVPGTKSSDAQDNGSLLNSVRVRLPGR